MQKWENFLSSLSTRGGKIFLLMIFMLLFSALLFFVAGLDTEVKAAFLAIFGTFGGALIGALRGGTTKNGGETKEED